MPQTAPAPPSTDRSLDLGPCRLDPRTRTLVGPAGETRLSPIACRLLEALAENAGAVVARRALIERLWAGNHLVGDPALNRLASEVRRAAASAAGDQPLVETVHGRGYRLAVAPTAVLTAAPEALAARPRSGAFYAWLTIAVLAVLAALAFVLILVNGVVWGLAE